MKCRVDELKSQVKSLDQLHEKIEEAWEAYDSDTLERIWAHQFACYREILNNDGGNNYDAPHSGIRTRQNRGEEVVDLEVDQDLIRRASELVLEYFDDV